MVIWSEFRMGRYRDNDHREHAPHFNVSIGDTVFDMASGKGGDLNKWSSRRVRHVTFADVASESVQQSRERYEERHKSKFSASFHVGDLTRAEPQRWEPPLSTNLKFDVVSCQFALHYCFESQKQCKTFVRNAAQNLKRGGYFFGTTIWSGKGFSSFPSVRIDSPARISFETMIVCRKPFVKRKLFVDFVKQKLMAIQNLEMIYFRSSFQLIIKIHHRYLMQFTIIN